MVDVIIPLHAVTGNDHNSGFYGKGKGVIMDRVSQSEEARRLLEKLGEYVELPEETMQDLILFVIRYIYNDEKSNSPAEERVLN